MPWIAGKRGAYRIMWRTGGRGSPVKASETFADKGDAMNHLREMVSQQAERRTAGKIALNSTPIVDLLKRWKESRLSGRRARGTYMDEACAHVQRMADEMKWTRIAEITTEAIDRWISRRIEGKGTDKPLQCVKAFLHWCRRTLKLNIDQWVLEVEPRRVPHRDKPPLLTDEQVAHILQRAFSFGPSIGTLIEHLLLYPCRPVDVSKMLVSDWDREARKVIYRETKNLNDVKHGVHIAHGERLDELTKGRNPDEFLFSDPWGRPWAIDKYGRATALTSWYKYNVGEILGGRDRRYLKKSAGDRVAKVSKNGNPFAIRAPELPPILARDQRSIYRLKDYGMTRLSLVSGGDRRAVVAISGHKTLSVVDRYMSTNEATQRRLIDAIAVPQAAALIPVSAETMPPDASPR